MPFCGIVGFDTADDFSALIDIVIIWLYEATKILLIANHYYIEFDMLKLQDQIDRYTFLSNS